MEMMMLSWRVAAAVAGGREEGEKPWWLKEERDMSMVYSNNSSR